ncbi:MAG TPA: Gfo/Idh/MocA family oxidoreductase [Chitinophagaceae bacterium]|nr:Gfo/Idh/MocA family oxidoreductase [Chitinophagaceae bacterium]
MKKINWGIIGCGDVTEVKSGPAFNKVNNSALIAVMRRDAGKAKDYAARHNVPKWYTEANSLINDPDINAIYIATPPSSHKEYTLAALKAGKPVYVEKPMSMNAGEAEHMMEMVAEKNGKLTVAHYRRAQPLFKKIKSLLADKAIGEVRFARLAMYKRSLTKEELKIEKTSWRVNPALAGGGLFHDLAPHQLDILYDLFGEADKAFGFAINQAGLYATDDIVTGNILFKNGVQFSGIWCFTVAESNQEDSCEIVGDKGKIIFSFFEQQPIRLIIDGKTETFAFDALQHVQQPMIEQVVNYFLGEGPNPCSAKDGVAVMRLIDQFTIK